MKHWKAGILEHIMSRTLEFSLSTAYWSRNHQEKRAAFTTTVLNFGPVFAKTNRFMKMWHHFRIATYLLHWYSQITDGSEDIFNIFSWLFSFFIVPYDGISEKYFARHDTIIITETMWIQIRGKIRLYNTWIYFRYLNSRQLRQLQIEPVNIEIIKKYNLFSIQVLIWSG